MLQINTSEIKAVLLAAGEFLLEHFNKVGNHAIQEKGIHDLVSFVDKGCEERIGNALVQDYPEISFLAEEGYTGKTSVQKGSYTWILDPLDGTTNYLHGVPVFCISLALEGPDGLEAGFIYDPVNKEFFSAQKGRGAYLNEQPIKVSSVGVLKDSLCATGFPFTRFGQVDDFLRIMKAFMKETRGIRRMGSAAIDLAWVAAGRFDFFFEYDLNPWDVAAGALLVKEAGGEVRGFDEGSDPVYDRQILAATPDLILPALRIIDSVRA